MSPPDPAPAPSFRFVVEEGKVAEFARAIGVPAPRSIAPPTFLVVCAHWMRREHSVLPLLGERRRRAVHVAQRFDYPRGAIPVGTVLRARQRFGEERDRPSSRGAVRCIDVVTAFWSDDESDPDAIMTTTLAVRPPGPDTPPPDRDASTATIGARSPRDPPLRTARITLLAQLRFQGASGDYNPLHHDRAAAHGIGLPDLPVVGMLTGSWAAEAAVARRDPRSLRTLDISWRSPAWIDDEVSLHDVPRDERSVAEVVGRCGSRDHVRAVARFADAA